MMQRILSCALAVLGFAAASGCTPVPVIGNVSYLAPRERRRSPLSTIEPTRPRLALQELQFKGSHNSYHRAPRLSLTRSWRYSHAPIDVQLAHQGVRQIELDVRYARGELVVGHLPIVDGRSNCKRLRECLGKVRAWSRAHPSHLPVFVFIEVKDSLAPARLDGRLDAIDFEIAHVFSPDELLTPAHVVHDAPSLREAIVAHGWPSLDESRGRIAFVLFGPMRHKRAYTAHRPRLEGRLMFVGGDLPDVPYASVLFYDDPVHQRREIDDAVAKHFLVRTRADRNLVRRRTRRDAALASGAHFVSTDFADPRFQWLELAAAGRCNPRSATTGCSSVSLSEQPTKAVAELAQPERQAAQN